MDNAGIDLLLVLAPVHINYLIGTPAKGYQEFQVLFFPREPGPLTLLTRLCEVPLFQAESLADDIRGWGGREPEDPISAVKLIMEEKGYLGRRIGLDSSIGQLSNAHSFIVLKRTGSDPQCISSISALADRSCSATGR